MPKLHAEVAQLQLALRASSFAASGYRSCRSYSLHLSHHPEGCPPFARDTHSYLAIRSPYFEFVQALVEEWAQRSPQIAFLISLNYIGVQLE